MKTLAAVCAAMLIASPVLAQATPPASTSPSSPTSSAPATTTTESQNAATSTRDGRPGRGASIKMQSPGGAEISVRCADGDTTRACADVVLQLLERSRGIASERRRDWSGDRDGTHGMMRDNYRDRDRERDRD